MKLEVCKNTEELVRKSTKWCERQLDGEASIFLPAGSTPIPLYAAWEKSQNNFLKGKQIIQLDEIISEKNEQKFYQFLCAHLPSYKSQIIPIQEAKTGAAIGVLGLGLNGHIAFHEPGVSDDFFKGDVLLTKKTCQSLKLKEGSKGLSFGLKAFLDCKALLLLVRGENKKNIFKKFLDHDESLPAVKLLKHKDLTVFVEENVLLT